MPDRPSTFSRSISAALRGYVRERAILQIDVAQRIKRSEGFVSARLTGKRPPDTDMIDAIATLSGVSTPRLYEELGKRLNAPTPDLPSGDGTADEIVAQARADAKRARKSPEPPEPPKATRRRTRGA